MTEINRLPAHILRTPLLVVGVPPAALLAVLSAGWPAGGRRLGVTTTAVAGSAPVIAARSSGATLGPPGVKVAVGTPVVGFAAIAVSQVCRIGRAGARAVWPEVDCSIPIPTGGSHPRRDRPKGP